MLCQCCGKYTDKLCESWRGQECLTKYIECEDCLHLNDDTARAIREKTWVTATKITSKGKIVKYSLFKNIASHIKAFSKAIMWEIKYGKILDSERTVECEECGNILFGDEPTMFIPCFYCYTGISNPQGWDETVEGYKETISGLRKEISEIVSDLECGAIEKEEAIKEIRSWIDTAH